MPRVALSLEQKRDYKLKDLKKWIRMQMAKTGKTQKDIGNVLGLSQARISQMLDDKKGNKENQDSFSYGQILMLCDFFGADKEEKGKLLTL